ncbi:trypsin-like serine protease [Conexibacter sp. JD483]|uniref:trypsin-like serine protease n=1 Tax=unclassified Conexibacter TaxID=2627773 RepID=UPI002717B13D|nr:MULTISPECIES: trypsin-like serine protease [unclassified Conexibacter]MDO8187606.1 trypsin-like serine protease [Conexibacter sp. CPCC 205706]MDO8201062.1 trypsin-like serine protease [Conexibacter sp. CPCC 205762]MDR9371833.1 trypsin-like serine protease [Conexibacter sp. JD483]
MTPLRRLTTLAVACLAVLFCAGSASAAEQTLGAAAAPSIGVKPAIVGGQQIPVTTAPWQVFVEATASRTSVYDCGGSILNATTILTAAHCVIDPATGQRFTAARLTVLAGTATADGRSGVMRDVADIRIHPYYQAAAGRVAPDDVAVLTLSGSLAFSTAIQPIGLVAPGAYPAVGTATTITGFGRQVAGGTPDRRLYALGTAIGDPLACGADANAIVLCVSSPAGSACEGDSGGPIVAGGVLLGVASFVQLDGPTGECGVGSLNGYTNLAAPEIRAFVDGSSAPPQAPRGGRDVSARGVFQARQAVTCSAGTWNGAPAFAYAFVDTASGTLLQLSGSDTYSFTDGDVGRTVACEVRATNAGGTALTRTQASPPIAVAPAPPAPPVRRTTPRPSLRLTVTVPRGKVRKGARVTHAIKVVNRGNAAARGVVVCDSPGKGLSVAKAPRKARRVRGRVCVTLGTIKPGAARRVEVTLKVAGRASRGAHVNAVTLSAANAARRSVTARVIVR